MDNLQRPITTLFTLMSLDGKISTGDSDDLDFDKDLPTIEGVKEGLSQYYDIEKTTDIFSLNTGRVMSKIGVNDRRDAPNRTPVVFVIVDNKPHLTENGVKYLSNWTKKLILVTTNESHPAVNISNENLEVLVYPTKIDFEDLLTKLKTNFGAKRLTVQSGGEMNATLIRDGLIDFVSVVVAPAIIGGRDTSTLVDGDSIHNDSDLKLIKSLKLINVDKLENSYLRLYYEVIN